MRKLLQRTMGITIAATSASLSFMPFIFANQTNGAQEIMDKPPDPEKAVASEYAELKRRGTIEAFELFIARHPDHPLANDARKHLKMLRGN